MITKEQVDQLGTWARWTNAEDICKIFGESLGMHIWHKWQDKHKGDFLSLWGYLDLENQQKIIDAVNKGGN